MDDLVTTSLQGLNDCGCCEGIAVQTPVQILNRPGLSAIAYRTGTHAQFKQSMLARLSGLIQNYPALRALTTRSDDDLSIALLDGWATIADVLTFYQERIANESYLRTATERVSLLQLARLIGYELRPGVAASTYLAFVLEDAKGAPGYASIDIGTKVQSIPGPGELPQTFETVEPLDARVAWNSLKVQMLDSVSLTSADTRVYLQGTATGLKVGDGLLFVGSNRASNTTSEAWSFRQVTATTPDAATGRTLVRLDRPLGQANASGWPSSDAQVYAMRKRAALFGYNAPDARLAGDKFDDIDTNTHEWNFKTSTVIDLDTTYPGILPGSWVVLSTPESPADATDPYYRKLYKVQSAIETSRRDYTLTAKVTEITPDTTANLSAFQQSPRSAVAFVQSEQLSLAGPLLPMQGNQITLAAAVPGLKKGQKLAVTGKRVRARVDETVSPGALVWYPDDGSSPMPLNPGQSLRFIRMSVEWWWLRFLPFFFKMARRSGGAEAQAGQMAFFSAGSRQYWRLLNAAGESGYMLAQPGQLELVPAASDDETLSEVVALAQDVADDHLELPLSPGLQYSYDPLSVSISANVALATHGETVQEVLGSGDASQPYQRFTLRPAPLTYTPSTASPSGAASTLRLRVNDVEWHEVPSLYGHGPRERIFITRRDGDGKTTIEFGDGQTGARPPTGQENISAIYRKGIGKQGEMKTGQLSLLMTRPLGVKGVTNPVPASLAQDADTIEQARYNAPLTVLTLDRVVSLQDYEDFARAFSGIAKALATWTWNGQVRGVFLTVAGTDGEAVDPNSLTASNLLTVMQQAGDPYVPLRLGSYTQKRFRLAASVIRDPDYQADLVLASVQQALLDHFSFDARVFGQPVTQGEVIAVMQNLPGVVAVDLTQLYYADEGPTLENRLVAAVPQAGSNNVIFPAELLTIDPSTVTEVVVTR